MPRSGVVTQVDAGVDDQRPIIPPNPATFAPRIIDCIATDLTAFLNPEDSDEVVKILDPFAGPGGIHALRNLNRRWQTFGVEIEHEWAAASPYTWRGDSRRLAALRTVARRLPFDAIATSPTYGNRMADHHEARDPCRACTGIGGFVMVDGDWLPGVQLGHANETIYRACQDCRGTGLTRRHTYRHELGRALTPGNAGAMQWGDEYRDLHRLVWVQCFDVLKDDGLFILNIKDHIRDGVFQGVPGWHLRTLQSLGFMIENVTALATGAMRHGANRQLRADAELVVTLRKGE